MPQPNLEIMTFVERQILPRYNAFGQSHGLGHVQRVIRNSLALAAVTGADVNMVYVIAAYHDLGMKGPRAIHHLTGGKILMADARLRRWFSAEQLKIMKEAVEDHRASSSRAPRSIYGKIVAEADRDLEPNVVFSRAVLFGFENYPKMNEEQMWERFQSHMREKYGRTGYLRLWIPGSPNAKNLEVIRKTIDSETELHKVFSRFYKQIQDKKK
ncbi:HD domain-containing protein [Prevotella multiformis]|uniref:HD domain protein n=1 Tax=Prevotella multiformis DSM 16608 TaxID=888743 RepID=F0FAD1_9BACT|nr:HD domain-containing protein [Prevotella multiformis]EGC18855.1 HD domain protein [Prevotella multiformis DSM 16608]